MQLIIIQKDLINWLKKKSSENVTLKQNFLEEGIIDSFGFITYIDFIEKKYAIKFSKKDFKVLNFASVDVLSQLIMKKTNV